jgi:hypothetical protein
MEAVLSESFSPLSTPQQQALEGLLRRLLAGT